MIIELCNGYYIDADEMNHTLKKRYVATNKETGEKYDADKVCGYFSTLESLLERFVKLNQIDVLPHTDLNLGTYIVLIKQINDEAVRAFKSVIEHIVEDKHDE